MWIVRLALRRPFTVAAFCLAVLLMGVLSTFSMSIDIFPSIDIPVVVVVWNYPGMAAEDMERRVTLVSERGYSTSVNGISRIDSQSINGISVIRVYFEQGADIGSAIAQISAASLSASRIMPPGMQPPVVLRYNASNVPVAQLTLSGKRSEQELYDYGANFLRIRLFTIPGLSTPAPYGGKQRQIMVEVDPIRAASKGLSAQDIVNAVLAQNVILPAGSARMGNRDYDILINGSPTSASDFNALPVKVVNGGTIYLGDVASVHDGFAVQQNMVRVNGRRATYLSILKKENASTLAVVDAAREMLPALHAAAPDGMEMKLEFDQSIFVRGAVWGVVREAIIAAALVAIMTLAFVGSWRSTIIVCVSIPLSILVGIIGLRLSGQTLNLMTMGGLSLAIGMLVDDATVEIENINRNRGQGKELLRAILSGARQIALPALAATTTICIVFFPVVLLTGPAQFLFIPLALSVVFAMMASYLFSRTLVPTMASLMLGREEPESEEEDHGDQPRQREGETTADKAPRTQAPAWAQKVERIRVGAFKRLRRGYTVLLEAVVSRRRFVLVCAGLFAFVSGCLLTVVGLDFFPSVDAGIMRFHYRAPAGTRIEQTERMVDAVEQRIRTIIPGAELDTIDDNIGVPISYNLGFVASDNIDGADAEILVSLAKKHRSARRYADSIPDAVRREMPGATIYAQQADVVGQVLNFGLAALASSLLTSLSSSTLAAPNFWVNPKNNVNYLVVVQTPIERIQSVADLMATPISAASGAPASSGIGFGGAPPEQVPPPLLSPVATYIGGIASLHETADRSVVNHATVQPVLDVQCNVVAVQMSTEDRVVTLPGDVRGFEQSTVYAKVSGYVLEMRVDRGDRVVRGQVLGVLESPETEQDVRSARSDALVKRRTAERLKGLAPSGVVSELDRDNAVNDARRAEAELDRTSYLRDYLLVRAPFDGIVTARYADQGALLPAATGSTQSAQPLVDLAEVDRVRIFFYVGQDAAPFVRDGDPVTLWQDELPDRRIGATVTRSTRALDPRTRTMQCEVDLDNRPWGVLPGTYLHVEVKLKVPPSPAVPTDAIVVRDGATNVARIEGGRVHFVPVDLGVNSGTTVRVNRGVAAGDRVGLNVPVEVVEGQTVQPSESPAPAKGGKDSAASKPEAPSESATGAPVLVVPIDGGAGK